MDPQGIERTVVDASGRRWQVTFLSWRGMGPDAPDDRGWAVLSCKPEKGKALEIEVPTALARNDGFVAREISRKRLSS